jgi:hypothetical protein
MVISNNISVSSYIYHRVSRGSGVLNVSYYPNSTDSSAFHNTSDNIPPTGLLTGGELNSSELDTVSTDDDNNYFSVGVTGYACLMAKIKIDGDASSINQFDITAKGYGEGGGTSDNGLSLFIWNGSSWGTALDSHSLGTKTTLTATITESLSSYIDENNFVYILTQATVGTELAGSSNYTYYLELYVS